MSELTPRIRGVAASALFVIITFASGHLCGFLIWTNSHQEQLLSRNQVYGNETKLQGGATSEGVKDDPLTLDRRWYNQSSSQEDIFDGIVARAFDSWPLDQPFPCTWPGKDWIKSQKVPTKQGVFFMKPLKTGSSTTAGITLRVARNAAKRLNRTYNVCRNRVSHGTPPYPAHNLFSGRNRTQSFLWTVIRDPTTRAISYFFHNEVSRYRRKPSDNNFKSFLRRFEFRDYYIRTLNTANRYRSRKHLNPVNVANWIMHKHQVEI